jgi:hypothetical protein
MFKTKIMLTIFVVWCMVTLLSPGCTRRERKAGPQPVSQQESQPVSQQESQPAAKENAPKAEAQIEILTPANDSKLEAPEYLVRGQVTNYSKGNVLVLVHPVMTKLIYVQRPPIAINRDGSWQTLCYLGTEEEGEGEDFELIAIITSRVLREGQEIEQIPTDAVISPIITVKRIK